MLYIVTESIKDRNIQSNSGRDAEQIKLKERTLDERGSRGRSIHGHGLVWSGNVAEQKHLELSIWGALG